ncbi:acyl-CoA dehydrogenase family protein [candidate division WOR-3 bacterium]|nr:acyl-CoA dehydrogenase family protein [candidate division WOR-3 bacterium]
MDYFISDEQRMIKDLASKIAKEKILPQRKELDEKEGFSHSIIQELAKSNMFKIFIPKQYDGLGMGTLGFCLVIEELSKVCAGVATTYAATALAVAPIILFGNEQQKSKYLKRVAHGTLTAFGLTEPEAGSDVGAVQTKAVKDGDFYTLNGTKQWITNGGEAEIYVIIASTNPERGARGLSAFIIEKGTPGFSFGKLEDKLGIRASCTRELIFEDCKIPASNLLSKEGLGFIIALRTFDQTRPGVGALSVGVAQGALDEAINYAKTHKQFGKPIISLEWVQSMIAELATKVEAARALVYSVARHIDSGAKPISNYSAMSKLFASDVAVEVTNKVLQIFGEFGGTKDYPVEKMFRDAKITQIYEGTNEIQKLVIASSLAK